MNPESIEERITKRTGPYPSPLVWPPLQHGGHRCYRRQHNLYIIEDAAEAHGAAFRGKKVGSFGHINCFSFYGNKIISTGEGGMCLTDDADLAQKMRVLRDHGSSPVRRYWCDIVGFNYRMTNLQAAVGSAQVDKLDKLIATRRQILTWYNDAFRHCAELGVIGLPPEMPWAESVCWLYSILIDDGFGMTRDEIIEELRQRRHRDKALLLSLARNATLSQRLTGIPCGRGIGSQRDESAQQFQAGQKRGNQNSRLHIRSV